jgi:AraC-like DNA-binding protein
MTERPSEPSLLDSLLKSFRLESAIQSRAELGEPWGVAFPGGAGMGKFHFVESGRGVLRLPHREPIEIQAGDFLVVMSDESYAIHDVKGTTPVDLFELLKGARLLCASGLNYHFGGDGERTSVISGKFRFQDWQTHPLWRAMPPLILIRGEDGRGVDWLETTLAFLACESTSGRPGAAAVLDRLCDVLFIQALRGWVGQDSHVEGLPAAVRDPAVGGAMALIHARPSEGWTVARLADAAAMSRSAFAERFRRVLGESPMGYLARWRMHLAARLLGDGRESVATVAQKVGYESEAAFAKAFKRMVGVAPGAYRRGWSSS